MGSYISDKNRFLNNHNIMLAFAIVFLVLAFIWLIGLSGMQTGSSTASGFGSLVFSSEDESGNLNPTYEVISEFFIALFLILGVAMLTYILTVKKSAQKLVAAGQLHSAIIVNGNKDISEQEVKEMGEDQVKGMINVLGISADKIQNGEVAHEISDYVGKKYNQVKEEYNERKARKEFERKRKEKDYEDYKKSKKIENETSEEE